MSFILIFMVSSPCTLLLAVRSVGISGRFLYRGDKYFDAE